MTLANEHSLVNHTTRYLHTTKEVTTNTTPTGKHTKTSPDRPAGRSREVRLVAKGRHHGDQAREQPVNYKSIGHI